eukprot:gene50420-61688_t
MSLRATIAGLALAVTTASASAETIRIAIGTQDTTINCATGGLLIRELGLLEKYLPHDGTYKDAHYEVEWKNFTSGAPLTNEMVPLSALAKVDPPSVGPLSISHDGMFPAANLSFNLAPGVDLSAALARAKAASRKLLANELAALVPSRLAD